MTRLSFVSAVVTAMISTSAFAQDAVYFKQTDEAGGNTAGIGTLTIEQTGTAKNRIGASDFEDVDGKSGDVSLVEGSLATLTIKQLQSSTVGTTNAADITLYGSNDSTAGSLVASFTGSNNAYDLTVGTDGDTTRYVDPDIALTVIGDNNRVTDTLANGVATGDTLNYAGKINGDNNIVTTKSGSGIGSVDLDYKINTVGNEFNVDMGAGAGDRDIDLTVDYAFSNEIDSFNEIDLVMGAGAGDRKILVDLVGASNDIDVNTGTVEGNSNVYLRAFGDLNNVYVQQSINPGNRQINVWLEGSNNNWIVNANASGQSLVIVDQYGVNSKDVRGTINQSGSAMGSSMIMTVEKAADGDFTVETFAHGNYQSAKTRLVALGGGSFSLTQGVGSTGDIYNASNTIADGGSVFVTQ